MRATTPPQLRLLLSLLLLLAAASASSSTPAADKRTTEPPGESTPLPSQVSQPGSRGFTSEVTRGTRGLFAPRVEYDEWTPLGHGDPLKNDPTYDYVPPVLERVRYWIEPPSRSPEPVRQTHYQTQTPANTHTYHHIPTTYINSHSQRLPIQSTLQYNNNNVQSTLQYNNNIQSTLQYNNNNNIQSTLQYNNADSRRDSYPFLTLVDGPKFNLPQSSPYKSPSHHHHQQQQQQYQVVPRPPNHLSRPSLPYRTPPSQTAVRPMTTPTFPPTQSPTSWFDLHKQQQQQQQQQQQGTRPPAVLLTPATSTVTPHAVTQAPSSAFTTQAALTTDPLFAHYKQPSEPLQGPMYLIIEGHSKVKTYGASKTIHGIPVDSNVSLRRQKRRRRRRRKLRKRAAL